MKKERRRWTSEEKIKMLKRHLVGKETVAKICEEEGVAPSQYHRWQEQLFGNAARALEGKKPERSNDQKKIAQLEGKIRRKDEVLAELMEEHVALKKELGDH